MPTLLFMLEAKRSPSIPTIQSGTVRISVDTSFSFIPNEKTKTSVNTRLDTIPPIAPSTVFLGLISGQSLCFPRVTPTK